MTLFEYFQDAECFSLKEAVACVEQVKEVKEPSIRVRIYEGIEKGLFSRIAKGVYTVTKEQDGEEVTCMQHIIYPNLMSADDYGSVIDQFAVATYANGKYKVWLYEFDAGNLKPLSKPTFEGNGRVACINYVSGNSSNFLF